MTARRTARARTAAASETESTSTSSPRTRRRAAGGDSGLSRDEEMDEEDVGAPVSGEDAENPEAEAESVLDEGAEAAGDDDDNNNDNDDEEDDEGAAEVTRCICGHAELQTAHLGKRAAQIDPGLFIQCDDCQVWQHGYCVGFYAEEDVPDVYYCERCRPELHVVVVRPSGKTSRYVPSEREKRGESAGSTEGGDAASGGGVGGAGSNGAGGSAEGGERSNGRPQRRAASAAAAAAAAAAASGASASPSANARETSVGRDGGEKSGGEGKGGATTPRRDIATRRRTMNSLRDESYEETLKRVLEESAHDAERARASAEPESAASGNEDGQERVKREQNGTTAYSRSRSQGASASNGARTRPSQSPSPSDKDKDKDNKTVPAKRKRPRSKRAKGSGASTPGRAGGAEGNVSSSEATHSPSKAGSASTVPSKRCKPRIPHPRSALPEMRKRVAAILEFIARTQADLDDEHRERQQLLADRIARVQQLYPSGEPSTTTSSNFDSLLAQHQTNVDYLGSLTQKLLKWEEQYGRYGDRQASPV